MRASPVSLEKSLEVWQPCLVPLPLLTLMLRLLLSGIILGPTVLGHIPGFTNNIFPQMSPKTADDPEVILKSFDTFYVAANVGLIFFMFLMGLEWDAKEVSRLAKYSFPIASKRL